MSATIYVPRTFGGTLIINTTPPAAKTSVTAIGRDGNVSGMGRDGKQTVVGRDGQITGKGR